VAGATRYPPNRRLLNHLAGERDHLFTFLRVPGVQATNWRAEHAIRPAVVCRKACAGNRTWAGAEAWQVLASVLRTASQQGRDPSSCSPACCTGRSSSTSRAQAGACASIKPWLIVSERGGGR
jgi:hypothetical protein